MFKYSHIEQFYQVIRTVKNLNKVEELPNEKKVLEPVNFRGTCKVHGTNAGVTHFNGEMYAQSRSQRISPESDNAGFASFVEQNKSAIEEIILSIRKSRKIGDDHSLTLFGELAGPGIQKGTAINKVPEKQWALFAVKVAPEGDPEKSFYIDAVPNLDHEYAENNIYSLLDGKLWYATVDFQDEVSKEKAVKFFDECVAEVEKQCPWSAQFGAEGIGEGIVWVPVGKFWGWSDLFFKTKGEKHKVASSKSKKTSLDPEVLKGIEDFLEFSLTENRLNQGLDHLREKGLDIEMRNMGDFLKWVGQDVQRECRLELEDNKLEWKQASKALNERARKFFQQKVMNG